MSSKFVTEGTAAGLHAVDLELLGCIEALQVHERRTKRREGKLEWYDPAGALRQVDHLTLTDRGVEYQDAEGTRIMDVHHRDRPESVFRGRNAVSIGFTTHYADIHAHFGPGLAQWCGGENIIVRAAGRITLDQIRSGLVIVHGAENVVLGDVFISQPCAPFGRYCISASGHLITPVMMKESLLFLTGGMRGFYGTPERLAPGEAATVSVGDRVYTLRFQDE